MNYNEKIKELTEKFIQEMESLKNKNQLLKVEKEKDLSRFDEHFKLADEKNNQVKNKKKLIFINNWWKYLRKKSSWSKALMLSLCKSTRNIKNSSIKNTKWRSFSWERNPKLSSSMKGKLDKSLQENISNYIKIFYK